MRSRWRSGRASSSPSWGPPGAASPPCSTCSLLDSPTSGAYEFFGDDVARYPENSLTRLRRDNLGFVFQSFNLIDDLTVAENVEVALIYRREAGGERKRRIAEALERVGIGHRAGHRP